MKRTHIIVALATIATTSLISTSLSAQTTDTQQSLRARERVGGQDKFGIGLDLGYPFNGVSFNYYPNARNLIQLEVGYHAKPGSFDLTEHPDRGLGFRAMYQNFPVTLAQGPGYALPFYVGLGASYAFNVPQSVGFFADDDTMAGSDVMTAFVPIGLQLRMRKAPVSLFAQVEPAVEWVRASGANLNESEVNFSPRLGIGASLHF